MHDLAKSLSCDTIYCQENNKWYLENHLSIGHLSVCHKPIELIDKEIGKCKKLRFLLFLPSYNSEIKLGPSTLASLFDELPYLRVLNLEWCQIQELPDNIGKLKLLFYINLQYTKIRSLPEFICQLYNLQVVNVEGCPLESFPKMIHNLINLRFMTDFREISSLIPGIGKLTSLQKLPEFKVLNKNGHKVEELKNMTQLEDRVTISNLENVESRGGASQAPIERSKYLFQLLIDNTSLLKLPFLLCPPRSLSSLKVLGSPEEKMFIGDVQGWLSGPENLIELGFEDCSNLQSLPEELHTLKTLKLMRISNCPKIQSLPENGLPPSLKKLYFEECHPALTEQLEQHKNSIMKGKRMKL